MSGDERAFWADLATKSRAEPLQGGEGIGAQRVRSSRQPDLAAGKAVPKEMGNARRVNTVIDNVVSRSETGKGNQDKPRTPAFLTGSVCGCRKHYGPLDGRIRFAGNMHSDKGRCAGSTSRDGMWQVVVSWLAGVPDGTPLRGS